MPSGEFETNTAGWVATTRTAGKLGIPSGADVDFATRGAWQHVDEAFKPGGATRVRLVLRLPGAKTGDRAYIDDVRVWPAA